MELTQLLFEGKYIFLKLSLYTHNPDLIKKKKKKAILRTSLAVQCLRLCASNVGATDLILVWGAKSHVHHGQKNKVILNVRNRIKAWSYCIYFLFSS